MRKYRQRPVVVEAVRFNGSNHKEMVSFMGEVPIVFNYETKVLEIPTLEGIVIANIGDYIVKGVQGEFYPCKPDVFELTYESMEAILRRKYEENKKRKSKLENKPVTPKRLRLGDGTLTKDYGCAECGDLVWEYPTPHKLEYCPSCGRKQDWRGNL